MKKERLCRKCKRPLASETPWYLHVCPACRTKTPKVSSIARVLKTKKKTTKNKMVQSKGATGFGITVMRIRPRRINVR